MIKKLLVIICGIFFYATVTKAENFVIKNYDVNITVDEQKQAYVTEKIDVNFHTPSHGIYRDIPRGNGSIDQVWASIRFAESFNGVYHRIKIGSPDTWINGPQSYTIKYRHKIYDGKAEFYYNIIGTEWNTTIENVRFAVKMPKNIAAEKVGISIGHYGVKGFSEGAEYYIKDNIIYGMTTNKILQPHEGITLRVEVPADYFNVRPNPLINTVWLGLFLVTAFSFLIWFLYGRDAHITPIVSFYPPKDINVLSSELICKEKVSKKSLVAMLIELAGEGFVKIVTRGKHFNLQKIKNYDGSDENKQILIDGIFDGNSFTTDTDLQKSRHFYSTCKDILAGFNSKSKRKNFYEKTSLSLIGNTFMAFCCGCTMLLTALILFNYQISQLAQILPMVIFMIVYIYLAIRSGRLLLIIIALFIFILPHFALLLSFWPTNTDTIPQLLCGAACVIITATCFVQMAKPNHKGRWYKAQLLGLKKFIEVAEKPRLEKLVEEQPQYFYNILPYAYIMDVSDKWVKQFEHVIMPQNANFDPTFFRSNRFNTFADSFAKTTAPSIANGGIKSSSSSGGGGFSGGGFGGGGGGSW